MIKAKIFCDYTHRALRLGYLGFQLVRMTSMVLNLYIFNFAKQDQKNRKARKIVKILVIFVWLLCVICRQRTVHKLKKYEKKKHIK